MYDWKWCLSDLKQDKDVNVFSCFACGGGSSMGYKRAGFNVLGCCEIDPRVNKAYVKNLHPKYNYIMDLRDFNKLEDLPEELYHLDILDGSPPCSTFTTAGQRARAWGKEKYFREGQKKQILDDLFFVFLETVERLRPKVVVAENVSGLIKGHAKGYVREIVNGFKRMGYSVQIFDLFASRMDVPQRRERVFFVANNQGYPPLILNPKGRETPFGEIRSKEGVRGYSEYDKIAQRRKREDRSIAYTKRREGNKPAGFQAEYCWDDECAPTVDTSSTKYRGCDGLRLSDQDIIAISTFPQDYDFCGEKVQYLCGMCVPPNMTANIATEIYRQWLS